MFLTRRQHDKLLTDDNVLLATLFKHKYRWSIGGIQFDNVSKDLVILVENALFE